MIDLIEARRILTEVLEDWAANRCGPWDVQDDAEHIEDQLVKSGLLQVQKETKGVAAQVDAALDVLTNGSLEGTLPKDIPALLALLRAENSEIDSALANFRVYRDAIDIPAREVEVRECWYGSST